MKSQNPKPKSAEDCHTPQGGVRNDLLSLKLCGGQAWALVFVDGLNDLLGFAEVDGLGFAGKSSVLLVEAV